MRQVVLATRRQGWRGLVGRTNGGMIVHLGVVALAVGLAASESYSSDRTVTLGIGETATVAGHEFRYLEPGADINDRRLRTFALVEIDGGDVYAPATTNYRRSGMVVPTPSVRTGFTEDVFLVLDEVPERGSDRIRLRVIVRPMVAWIWGGGFLMAAGTALALFPGRRRRGTEAVSAAVPEADDEPSRASGDGTPTGDRTTGDLAADAVPDRSAVLVDDTDRSDDPPSDDEADESADDGAMVPSGDG
jgi:cytochrome c-type biogenesis protein CcmF